MTRVLITFKLYDLDEISISFIIKTLSMKYKIVQEVKLTPLVIGIFI